MGRVIYFLDLRVLPGERGPCRVIYVPSPALSEVSLDHRNSLGQLRERGQFRVIYVPSSGFRKCSWYDKKHMGGMRGGLFRVTHVPSVGSWKSWNHGSFAGHMRGSGGDLGSLCSVLWLYEIRLAQSQ